MFDSAICQHDHFDVGSFHSFGEELTVAKPASDFSTYQSDHLGLLILLPGSHKFKSNGSSLGTSEQGLSPRQIRLSGMHRDGRSIRVGDGEQTIAYVKFVLRTSRRICDDAFDDDVRPCLPQHETNAKAFG